MSVPTTDPVQKAVWDSLIAFMWRPPFRGLNPDDDGNIIPHQTLF